MFAGTFEASVEGARIALPKEIFVRIGDQELTLFRQAETERFFFYSKESLEEFKRRLPLNPAELLQDVAKMLATAHVLRIDQKRRMVLPKEVKTSAKIEKKTYFVGAGQFCFLQSRPYL